jgi:hypothetical protein
MDPGTVDKGEIWIELIAVVRPNCRSGRVSELSSSRSNRTTAPAGCYVWIVIGGRPCRWCSKCGGRPSHGCIDSSQIESLGGGKPRYGKRPRPLRRPQDCGLLPTVANLASRTRLAPV